MHIGNGLNGRRWHLSLGLSICALAVILSGCGGGSSDSSAPSSDPPVVTTLAGVGTAGTTDGSGGVARFSNPVNVAVDTAGNVYVCDFDNSRLRKITPAGAVTTLTNQANFDRPFGIAFTPDGRLFVSTDGNDLGARDATTGTLWQINLRSGAATVVARNLGRPRGLVALSNAQMVLADVAQNDVRLINLSTKAITPLAGLRGTSGFVNGSGSAARFNRPYGPALTRDGNILLADQGNNALRLITPSGVATTFAGGTAGYRDGAKAQALFNAPQDVDIAPNGTIYVSDNENHRIRRIDSSGNVTTFAGNGVKGFAEGTGTMASFFGQEGLALNRDGSLLYVADGNSGDGGDFNRVRRLAIP